MRFLRSHDTLSLNLHNIMTCMHISKKYKEIHGGRTNLTIRNMRKYLPPPHKIRPKTLDSTDTVDFTHFRRTVNRYCDYSGTKIHSIPKFERVTPLDIKWTAPSLLYLSAFEINQYENG